MYKTQLAFVACLSLAVLNGCSSYQSDTGLIEAMGAGDFGTARVRAIQQAPAQPSDKSYILGKTKIVLASMADGVPESTEGNVDELYDFLRTQGVNKGKEVLSFVTSESNATFWKGEPFEQAMGYAYIAAFDGQQGDWGNVRASASNSIFLIRDFSDAIERGRTLNEATDESQGEGLTPQQSALADREAILADAQNRSSQSQDDADETGQSNEFDYQLVESDFELGYLLQAIASDQLAGLEERDEYLRSLRTISPRFNELASQIRSGAYNTVVMVSYGIGPEKYGDGYDQVIEMYRPRTRSGDEQLVVHAGGQVQRFPVVTDVNRLALDTRWSNLEGMRTAKSIMGTVLLGGGVAVMAGADSPEEMIAGAILAGVGWLAKESAKADTRHCEVFPQRTYIALLNLPVGSTSKVELSIENMPLTRLVLPAVSGPRKESDQATFHYVRLSEGDEPWRTSANVYYANDLTGSLRSSTLPYILGGECMRTPTPELMEEYYSAGLPRDVAYEELVEVYKDEGIVIAGMAPGAEIGRHICEGGNTLYTPLRFSSGFARIYGQTHQPYQPKGELLLTLSERINGSYPTPLADALR